MTIIRVGGLNPVKRVKTLAHALSIAKDDDTIELHKTINESVVIQKSIILKGNKHQLIVPLGKTGIRATTHVELYDLNIKVASRSNALVFETSARLEHIDIHASGKIREFYPLVIFKSGVAECYDCQLKGARSEADAVVKLEHSALNSYYPGDVVLSTQADASTFLGPVSAHDSYLASCVFENTLEATECDFVRNVNIHAHAIIKDSSLRNEVLKAKANWRKKEPENGPLVDEIEDLRYTVMFNGATATIDNYNVTNALEGFDGFAVLDSTLQILNTTCLNGEITHKAIDSTISFVNTQDQNTWLLSNSPTSRVNATINSNQDYVSALDKLKSLIGLAEVKTEISTILNTISANSKSTDADTAFGYHMVFAGNPGSGKTSVARLVTQALFEIGAISENKFTEASSETLIGEHVGSTAPKTKAVLDEARGGVLFIDEAYELAYDGSQNSFNSEALSLIISQIENNRSDLIVIMAGYPKEMRQLLASNPGLTRRMRWVNFEDYTPQDMVDIFNLMRETYQEVYALDVVNQAEALIHSGFKQLSGIYQKLPDAHGRTSNGGNGGLVRNVLQAVLQHKNNRLSTGEPDQGITQADVLGGFKTEAIKAVRILKDT